jgi:hypothetical protein
MIARSALPFTLLNILDRVGLTSPHRRTGPMGGTRLSRWRAIFAALGDRSALSKLGWHNEILLRDQPARFLRFCRDCGQDTPQESFDEFGAGWYARICRCRYCRRQRVRVWPLAGW